MINTLIVGINGKMGERIYKKAKEYDLSVVCGVDKKVGGNYDCPVYKSFDEIKENVELIIDFSSPTSVFDLCKFVKDNPCPLFFGATGLKKEEKDLLLSLAKKIPLVIADNTSRGVNILLKLAEICADSLEDCNIEIIEKHHKYKKDAPSGTALLIKNTLAKHDKPSNKGVFIHSVRGGTIVGEHEVLFMCENEIISLKHEALSAEVFADGALKAAAELIAKPVGIYTMNDFYRL